MNEQEMRLLVRDAIARHGMAKPTAAREGSEGLVPATFLRSDPGHAQFMLPSGPEGSCVIEPAVMCTHCGYCKSYGH
jgi:hypothetical protein